MPNVCTFAVVAQYSLFIRAVNGHPLSNTCGTLYRCHFDSQRFIVIELNEQANIGLQRAHPFQQPLSLRLTVDRHLVQRPHREIVAS